MAVNLGPVARVYNWLAATPPWPGLCQLCGTALPADELLCAFCGEALAAPGPALCRCGLDAALAPPEPDRPERCGRCLTRTPAYSAVWPALWYQPPLDGLIRAYKHRRRLEQERLLLRLWLARMARRPPPTPDALVPLPCHWRRHWWRGFSPAERLARGLAQALALPLHPALIRYRATPTQQGLSRPARERNLARAFHCRLPVTGLHIALVDDVMTTGSTARTAARVLTAAGARRVDVWVLARTASVS